MSKIQFTTFIYNNLSSSKLYLTNLQYNFAAGKYHYQYNSAAAFKIDDKLKFNNLVQEKIHPSIKAFTNIKRGSNLFKRLQQEYQSLEYFKTDKLNFEQWLFKVKDAILGKDLTFSTPYHRQKILNYFSGDNLSSLNSGDNCFLASLVYLIAAIEKPNHYPAIGSFSTYSIF